MRAEISVMFNVKEVERSVRFYRKLGFDVRWKWKGDDGKLAYAGVGIGGAVIALGRIPPKGKEGGGGDRDYRDWVSTPLGAGIIVSVELQGVERLYQRARQAKVEIEEPLRERPYGTAFVVNDPDGYVVRFLRPKGEFA
jgi:catechol 2,3-dioxygenase-like lactoylglutathione lyase family enzyme